MYDCNSKFRWLVLWLGIVAFIPSQSLRADGLSIHLPTGNDSIVLHGRDARFQLVISLDQSDEHLDVTDKVDFSIVPPIATVDASGYLKPLENGETILTAKYQQWTTTVRVTVDAQDSNPPVNFPNQVVPIFTKLGCNGGGCHGKAAGQAGFKLSLLGFEPKEDFEHLVIESRGRRTFPAMADRSLLLLKAINAEPHGGGKRVEKDSQEYRILRRWIATGMPYGNPDDPTLEHIEVFPLSAKLQTGSTQQLSVLAYYTDGSTEDITRTAQFESNNTDLATVGETGRVQMGSQPGDVSIMARYQGQVAVFRASIPLGISFEPWANQGNVIDEAVIEKLRTLGIPPSSFCDDSTFIRRATLDICGRLPTIDETRQYLADDQPQKIERLIERLLASPDYADFFAKKWSTILRNRRDSAGDQLATFALHAWVRDSLNQNKPYSEFVRQLLTASGSVEANPAVAWWGEVSNTESRVEDAAQLFLGQRLQCARCHHHPYEKWSQKDYFQVAAFFSKVSRKEGETNELPMFVSRLGGAGSQHPKTGEGLKPAGLDTDPLSLQSTDDPRIAMVDWMVTKDNPFFAKSLVNRYWKHFFATGLVEPEDDMRVTNPPSNPELMDRLSTEFIESDFDLKNLVRTICTSQTYRLSGHANEHNLGDTNSYSRFYPKRLQAEVLLDAIDQIVETQTDFAGMPLGTRAIQLPDNGFNSYFLDVFGRPPSTTACECERSQEATLAQSLHLLNSKEVQAKLAQTNSRPNKMAASDQSVPEKLDTLYLAAFSRMPSDAERETAVNYIQQRSDRPQQAYEDLVWAILNSKEFLFNH